MNGNKVTTHSISMGTTVYVLSHIMSQCIEDLKGTPLYSRKLKSLLNQVQPETDKYVEIVYRDLIGYDPESAETYHHLIDCVEVFIDALKSSDIFKISRVLCDFKNGNILELPEGKHGKIISQLDKYEGEIKV